jgi:hypothetical protein
VGLAKRDMALRQLYALCSSNCKADVIDTSNAMIAEGLHHGQATTPTDGQHDDVCEDAVMGLLSLAECA